MSDHTPEEQIEDAGSENESEVVEAELVATTDSTGIEVPDDPEQAVEVLMTALMEARGESESYLDDLQRVAADFDNYRKRVQREQAELVVGSTKRLVLELLPVLDSYDIAFTHEAQSPSEEKLLAGMRSTYQLLFDTLAKEGLAPIDSLGEPFDPELHEAVQAPADSDGDLVVTSELRRGYTLAGKVVRPTLVAVDHA